MVTKRGTNQFHGAAYEYLLSSYFSANHLEKQPHARLRSALHPARQNAPEPLRRCARRPHAAELAGRQDILLRQL